MKPLRVATAAVLTVAGVGLAGPASTAAPTSSAVTVRGSGPFADLRVTVDQTRDLIAQVVTVSWTGGRATQPTNGQYALHYLQVMQCWGDDAAGPQREQCQYGGLAGDLRGGAYAASRQVSYGAGLVDPLETYRKEPGSAKNVYVPFRSVNGKVSTEAQNEFFDGYSTNEIPFARTRADGTGLEYFEAQTGREAPGLGCGHRAGKSCWLVVVPRGDVEVDGSRRTTSSDTQLQSSPLSATNWSHRLVVPLDFQPLGSACPIGATERETFGHELVAEAVHRWQPVLCSGKRIFSFSQVADGTARRKVLTPDPGMVFVTTPPSNPKVVAAPVALSGIAIAFNVESQAKRDAPQ